jgi:FixJ family two-component response regulator
MVELSIGSAIGATAKRVPTESPRRGYDERLDVLKTQTLEVALCVIAGDDVRQIAAFLEISPSTVRRHAEIARQAFGCASLGEFRRRFATFEKRAA